MEPEQMAIRVKELEGRLRAIVLEELASTQKTMDTTMKRLAGLEDRVARLQNELTDL